MKRLHAGLRSHRPYVTLKSALTLDGQLALAQSKKEKKRVWITDEESRAEVQRMRHASDALLTGIGTILADDPLLTDRSGLQRRRKLLRVIVDTKLRLPAKARIVKTADDDLLVFTAASLKSAKARALQKAGVELVGGRASAGKIDLESVMTELGRREILSVLLEAGPRMNASALAAGVVHKLMMYYAPKLAGDVRVPFVSGKLGEMPGLHFRGVRQVGPDVAMEFLVRREKKRN